MSKLQWAKIDLEKHERRIVSVVATSSIASIGIADGKNLPVIFIDTTNRPDIKNAIHNHLFVESGDVSTAWVRVDTKDNDNIQLLIELKKPSECKFVINFEIYKHGGSVDLIMNNGGCYLQSAEDGTKVSQSINAPRILVEVISPKILNEWDKIYQLGITRMFIRKKIKPKKAADMAESFIKLMKKMNFRMK